MKFIKLLDICLNLFDGGDAGNGAAGAAAQAQGETGAQGETTADPGNTRREKPGETKVVYGKQAAQSKAADSQSKPPDAGGAQAETPEDRRKAFQELVNGQYKDIYTEETQRIIDRRFRDMKALEQQVQQHQPILDALMQKYKIKDGDIGKLSAAIDNDNAYWADAAEEAGMGVEQFKQFQQLRRENAALMQAQRQQAARQQSDQQLQKWYGEGEQVKAVYPGFDLGSEVRNPQFLSMLKAGVPVQHAYEVVHIDDIKAGVAQGAAKRTEKQVVDTIRSKGTRPAENGTSAQSGFTIKDDVSKFTAKDRAEVLRRAHRGERIEL